MTLTQVMIEAEAQRTRSSGWSDLPTARRAARSVQSLRNYGGMPLATLIESLDQHQGAATVFLTAALVAVTGFYAWQNRRMAQEMRHARNATILPKLALEFHRLGPTVVDLAIRNVGPGSALDIDVTAEWVPLNDSASIEETRWRRNLLSPSEQVELVPPGDLGENLNTLPQRYKEIRLRGTLFDAAGTRHAVDEKFADLPAWRDIIGDARESWKPPQPEARAADALLKKFDRPLKDLTKATNEVARAVRDAAPPSDDS